MNGDSETTLLILDGLMSNRELKGWKLTKSVKKRFGLTWKTMKTICIYHSNCLDGFASAFIIWKTLGPKVEFIPAVYGKEPPLGASSGQRGIYCRFFLSSGYHGQDLRTGSLCNFVIDHHESAIEVAGFSAENYTAKFDITRAGTDDAWIFFGDRKCTRFFRCWLIGISGISPFQEQKRSALQCGKKIGLLSDGILISGDYHKAFLALHNTGSKILKMNARNIEGILKSGTRQVLERQSLSAICHSCIRKAGNI